MAAPPGFDATATVLPPGPDVRIEVQRGGARGGVMFSAEDEELLSQYGLAVGGIIADKIDEPTKAAFLTQIKSGACGKGTGDLVILQKDCWAVVKVIRALIQTSMRGGMRSEKRDGQRGGGFLDTLRGLVGSKKVAPTPMAAGGAAAGGTSGAAGGTEKPYYTRDPRRAEIFLRQRDRVIATLKAQVLATGADIPKILNDKKIEIDRIADIDLGEAEIQAGLATMGAQAVRNELGKRKNYVNAGVLLRFYEEMLQKQLEYTQRISAAKSRASGRMDPLAALTSVAERGGAATSAEVDAALAGIEATGGGAAEGATAGVPAVVPATSSAAPMGAGTGLGIVSSTGRNSTNSGASSPEATPTLRSAGASPVGRGAMRTPAVTRPAAAVVAGENARITAARTVRNTAQRELTAAGYTPHKIRPVWLRENVSERSLPIHYNVKEGKWRGNAKEGLTFYSVYGENPENVVARYRNIKTKRNNLAAKSKALKNAEETVRQEKLAAAQATLATQKAATAERKAALKEAERIEREARKNVRSTQTLGERVKSFFGRGGSRKAGRKSSRKSSRKSRRMSCRKTRRAERK